MNLDPEKVAIFIITFTLLLACIHASASPRCAIPNYPVSINIREGVCIACPKDVPIPNTPKYISYMGWLSIPFGEKPKLTFMVTNKI